MRHAASEQVEIVLRTLPSGQYCTVSTDKGTAELFGLFNHYDKLLDVLETQYGLRGYHYGARAASKKRRSTPRKATFIRVMPEDSETRTRSHTFRLGSKASLFDIAELAHFIEVDWHFLVGPDGRRHDRAWWEDKYLRGPHKASAAA